MKINSVLIIVIACLFFVSACTDLNLPADPQPVRELNDHEKQLAEADNVFSLKLFREVNNVESEKDIFISPLSVSFALGMTLNGAAEETYQAIRRTLEFDNLDPDEINATYKSLIEYLTKIDPKVAVQIANSIWYREGFSVKDEFLKTNQFYFNAEIAALNFADPDAVVTINNWVDNNTNGKITRIVDTINDEIVMLLINAVYFKGDWMYEFDPEDTFDGSFYLPDGSTEICRMMPQENTFDYFSNDSFQAVDLPYGNSAYSMTVFLPAEEADINQIIKQMDGTAWENWINGLSQKKGRLVLPKFKKEYDINLNDILKTLGMEVAFNAGVADFSNINETAELFISKVTHKTFIEVDEKGTEAAAVTAVEVGVTSVDPDYFVMEVNRPFFFVIREKHSGTILFMGKILNPNNK
ncbi:MAG: serpin family protein [Calditrichaceae bacterium]